MTRAEIIAMFRTENPEFTERALPDTRLHAWCKIGDKEIAAETRCIVSDTTFNSVVTTSVYSTRYDLTDKISKFFDIDDYPGGGVSYDDEPLEKTTIAELDEENYNWRTRSAGTPDKYYRRGKWLYFDYPVKTADKVIRVYAVLISDDFDDDSKTPFNQLTYLEPYHYSLVLFLQKKAKMKRGNTAEEAKAIAEFSAYIKWMKRMLGAARLKSMKFQPTEGLYSTG